MRRSSVHVFSVLLLALQTLQFQARGAPAGPLLKHLSSLMKWKRASSKTPSHSDGNYVQFESGYLVETVVEGIQLGVIPHSIRVSKDGEIFAVDAMNDNVVRISPPLSQYSRPRLVAGSFEGHRGHVDGKPNEARFNRPKGVTMDDKGNVYVADTANLAIRKIGEAGVTTIAGGKSSTAGYRDGPSEHAMFSNDFDVLYVPHTCSLLVVDRGNAALRRISLNEPDCHRRRYSLSATDIAAVIAAFVVGYAFHVIKRGIGPSVMTRTAAEDAGRTALRLVGTVLSHVLPSYKVGLTPLKDALKMPDDDGHSLPPLSVQKLVAPPPPLEEKPKPSSGQRDLSLSSKIHHLPPYYGRAADAPKEKPHRRRSKQPESGGPKSVSTKTADYPSYHFKREFHDAYRR